MVTGVLWSSKHGVHFQCPVRKPGAETDNFPFMWKGKRSQNSPPQALLYFSMARTGRKMRYSEELGTLLSQIKSVQLKMLCHSSNTSKSEEFTANSLLLVLFERWETEACALTPAAAPCLWLGSCWSHYPQRPPLPHSFTAPHPGSEDCLGTNTSDVRITIGTFSCLFNSKPVFGSRVEAPWVTL